MKKILLVSAVALGLSSAALANGSNPMMAAPAAPVATAAVSDFTPGLYLGLQGGYADAGWKALNEEKETVNHNQGLAGRLFVGYDFHKHFAMELGYFMFEPKTELTVKDAAEKTKLADIRTQAFDLVGKIKAPFADNFGLYAKAGAGYLMIDNKEKGGDKTNKFDLVYGFGAYYTLADNWTADLGYSRYNSGHTKMDKNWQPVVDFYSLGVSYKFNLPV